MQNRQIKQEIPDCVKFLRRERSDLHHYFTEDNSHNGSSATDLVFTNMNGTLGMKQSTREYPTTDHQETSSCCNIPQSCSNLQTPKSRIQAKPLRKTNKELVADRSEEVLEKHRRVI